jgi:hypothetical protein
MPPRHVGAADEIPTPPRKLVFCHRMTPHAPLKVGEHHPRVDVCNTRVNNFFLIIFVFIKKSNCPHNTLDYNEKNHDENIKKNLERQFSKISF